MSTVAIAHIGGGWGEGRRNTGNETEAKARCLDSRAKLAGRGTAHHAEVTAEALAGKKKSMASPLAHQANSCSRYSADSSWCTGPSGRVMMYAAVWDGLRWTLPVSSWSFCESGTTLPAASFSTNVLNGHGLRNV